MDFQIYDCQENCQILLLNETRDKNWNLAMENDEYFNWTGDLKIDESKFESEPKNGRKRKLQDNDNTAVKAKHNYAQQKDADVDGGNDAKKTPQNNGTSRMPQWQVDDIADLNADIEGSLNGLAADHSNNSFNMSEAILSLSSMTVFKQEAPSPTNNNHDSTVAQFRQGQANGTGTDVPGAQTNGENHNSSMLNTTLHQLLSQSGYNSIQNTIDGNLLNSPNTLSQDGYCVTSTNSPFTEDCRFQYVLAAATSIATKINEDTLTYLNQGQSYEIKLKKLGDLSMYRGKLLKSVIRICFHERRLQYMEKEQMNSWQQSRPGDRILEVDVPLSYGLYDVIQPTGALNTVQFSWDPTKEVGAYIKVNCISTEFTPKKHGGEKGVPFRIQVETYQTGDGFDSPKRLHAAACQIKVFKLKGADRKHKQDREKILKRPISEQEKYQPSYDCTVLNDIPNESVLASSPINTPYSPERRHDGRLIGRRVSLRMRSAAGHKATLSRLHAPSLRGIVKRNTGNIKHHLRTIKICSQNNFQNQTTPDDNKNLVALSSPTSSISPIEKPQCDEQTNFGNDQLAASATTLQTTNWLTTNRFEKYLQTFSSFSGADMLRMSRDDFIQICGHADGIRLYNSIHSKSISPKLTIYVCRDTPSVFNAIFLSSLNTCELVQKLSNLLSVPNEQVRDVYIQGPQSIHVQLSNDFIKHIKDETMFQVDVLQEGGRFVFLLKHFTK